MLNVRVRRPRIAAIGYRDLADLMREAARRVADEADVRVIDRLFDDALATVRELASRGEADVVVSGGATGTYLREHVDIPVVLIKVSGFDILRALKRAREVSNRVAVFPFESISDELEEVKEILNLQVVQVPYAGRNDALESVRRLNAEGMKVVVASSMVTEFARDAGMTGIFFHSARSVESALRDGIEIARARLTEQSRRERLNLVLRHLRDGVLAIDDTGAIEAINPAMARIAGVEANDAIGRSIEELFPELALGETLANAPEGDARSESDHRVERIRGGTYLTDRIPIVEAGAITGAVLTVQSVSQVQRADRQLRSQPVPDALRARVKLQDIVGESVAMREAIELARRYARSDSSVLVTGESGTGKELFAQGIHNASPRARRPFIAINCAAIPENLIESELFGYEDGAFTGARRGGKPGLFEAAHRGTVFLDEIGDLPLYLQPRLLRVLQEREVTRLGAAAPTRFDVRVIAATNRDLDALVREGRFREDLLYRLDILRLALPSLRNRADDLAGLTRAILERRSGQALGTKTRETLVHSVLSHGRGYHWPGNVRELENWVERAVSVAEAAGDEPVDTLVEAALRRVPRATIDATPEARPEALALDRALAAHQGNRAAAARALGISRTTLWRRMNTAR